MSYTPESRFLLRLPLMPTVLTKHGRPIMASLRKRTIETVMSSKHEMNIQKRSWWCRTKKYLSGSLYFLM